MSLAGGKVWRGYPRPGTSVWAVAAGWTMPISLIQVREAVGSIPVGPRWVVWPPRREPRERTCAGRSLSKPW